jgi:hypothetical protein
MTLVSALTGNTGTIMFADTDEVIGGYSKKTIDKLEVWDFPDRPFRFGIAGATNNGTYADMLQSEITATLMSIEFPDLNLINDALTKTLTAFYSKHIWPQSSGDRPQMEYLIVLQSVAGGHLNIIHICDTAVNFPDLTTHLKNVGVGAYLADYLFSRILTGGEPVEHLIAAAVYVANEVHNNIEGVGPIDRMAVFYRDGTYDELYPKHLAQIADNIYPLNEVLNAVFSDAMDLSSIGESIRNGPPTIAGILAEIREAQGRWHEEWMQERERRKHILMFYRRGLDAKRRTP